MTWGSGCGSYGPGQKITVANRPERGQEVGQASFRLLVSLVVLFWSLPLTANDGGGSARSLSEKVRAVAGAQQQSARHRAKGTAEFDSSTANRPTNEDHFQRLQVELCQVLAGREGADKCRALVAGSPMLEGPKRNGAGDPY